MLHHCCHCRCSCLAAQSTFDLVRVTPASSVAHHFTINWELKSDESTLCGICENPRVQGALGPVVCRTRISHKLGDLMDGARPRKTRGQHRWLDRGIANDEPCPESTAIVRTTGRSTRLRLCLHACHVKTLLADLRDEANRR